MVDIKDEADSSALLIATSVASSSNHNKSNEMDVTEISRRLAARQASRQPYGARYAPTSSANPNGFFSRSATPTTLPPTRPPNGWNASAGPFSSSNATDDPVDDEGMNEDSADDGSMNDDEESMNEADDDEDESIQRESNAEMNVAELIKRLLAMQGAPPPNPPPIAVNARNVDNANRGLVLYQLLMGTIKGDWDGPNGIKNILENSSLDNPVENYFTHQITDLGETVLHMAVQIQAAKNTSFVENVLNTYVSKGVDLRALRNAIGRTPLHEAAEVGSLAAVKMLVEKDRNLLLVQDTLQILPVEDAALAGRSELLAYLVEQTRQADPNFFEAETGIRLLNTIVMAGFNDIAFQILSEFPGLALRADRQGLSTLVVLGGSREAFPNGSKFGFWESIIYSWVPIELENPEQPITRGDVENPNQQSHNSWLPSLLAYVRRKLSSAIWKLLEILAPIVKHIRNQKIMHQHALKLTKLLCSDVNMPYEFAKQAAILAAEFGIHEILEEVLRLFPFLLHTLTRHEATFFETAVKYRYVNVYNLMFQMSDYKYRLLQHVHPQLGSLLHFAARLPPTERLNVVSGAALQLQRELQWFKEVEKVVRPSYKDKKDGNSSNPHPNWKPRTPAILFAEEHRELIKEGEQWMKGTANSCTIAAVLIATVVFAASITVPGGTNSDSGSPIFSKNKAFVAFAVADAIALYSSVASVIMFLSILTSRYTQEDFIHSLPQKLIIGLLTLFLSMTSMMAAFSAAMYLVFGNQKSWIFVLVGAFSCLPVSLFVFSQFPLLVEMISSTYGHSIFRKQSDQIIF